MGYGHNGQRPLRGGKTQFLDCFYLHWASETKSKEKSRIFRYGFPKNFLIKVKKPQQGGGWAYSVPPCMLGLNDLQRFPLQS